MPDTSPSPAFPCPFGASHAGRRRLFGHRAGDRDQRRHGPGARVAFAGRRQELLDDGGRRSRSRRSCGALRRHRRKRGGRRRRRHGRQRSAASTRSSTRRPSTRWSGSLTSTQATWTHLLATNVVGASLITRAALPHLRAGARPGALHLGDLGRPAAARHGGLRLQQGRAGGAGAGVAVGVPRRRLRDRRGRDDARHRGHRQLGPHPARGAVSASGARPATCSTTGPARWTVPEVADSILAVLAAPTFMPYVAVLPDPARAASLG